MESTHLFQPSEIILLNGLYLSVDVFLRAHGMQHFQVGEYGSENLKMSE